MNNLTDFIRYSLYPALYDRIDSAFPDMDFKRVGGDWRSSKKLSGEDSSPYRADKTVVTKKVPTRILEQGGESLSLVSYQLRRLGYSENAKGAELIEALRSLCVVCGLELPSVDSEEYQAYKEKQERLERLALKMRRDLFSPAGAETLAYLKNVRGYSEETIKAMELGYCSSETASQMEEAPYGAGDRYKLAIPYRSGSSILGFKLRVLDDTIKPKYKNTSGLPKKASLFGLTGLLLTGNGEKDRDLTVVEGELDALHAITMGVENIVAASGGEISQEALQEAKRRGVERITVLFDTERTDNVEGTIKTEEKKEKAIRAIQAEGLSALVAELPSESGDKVDIDSYLRTHSKEQLTSLIDKATSGAKYLFLGILQKAINKQGGEGETITDKYLEDYKREVIELLNDSVVTSPVDRDTILTLFAQSTSGIGITKEAIQAEADRKKAIEDEKRQKAEAIKLADSALSLAKEGRVEEALRLMSKNSSETLKISNEAKYGAFLGIPSADDIRAKLKERPEGITTDYIFTKGRKKERLLLPAGGLTLVCGGTSHGKSVFLRNLALQTALKAKDNESVLYFSFEEDYESTIVELLNTYVDRELTRETEDYNNLTTITEYYRSGSLQYVRQAERDNFLAKEKSFLSEVVEAGRLRVLDSDLYSNELVEAISFLSSKLKVKAVFVDYIQLLYKEGIGNTARNEQLKAIAKELRQLAKGLKLPIILAAQLNRDAKSPSEMHSQNIADSADLEREANKVVLIWNSAFRPLNGSGYNENDIEEEKRLTLGTPGELYLRLSKNRGGEAGIDTKLTFHRNTGAVLTNSSQYEEKAEGERDTKSLQDAIEDEDLPF